MKYLFLFFVVFSVINGEIYHIDSDDAIALRKANFSDQFITELATTGYLHTAISEMIEMKATNIGEDVILYYISQPLKIRAKDIILLRKTNFGKAFIKALILNGYSETLSINEMMEMKKNRISEELILQMAY